MFTAGFVNYTIFSLWDTYREHPLLTLLDPKRISDMINSMLTTLECAYDDFTIAQFVRLRPDERLVCVQRGWVLPRLPGNHPVCDWQPMHSVSRHHLARQQDFYDKSTAFKREERGTLIFNMGPEPEQYKK